MIQHSKPNYEIKRNLILSVDKKGTDLLFRPSIQLGHLNQNMEYIYFKTLIINYLK